jgi:hypothetical protein
MKRLRCVFVGFAFGFTALSSSAALIDNGLAGDGRWQVDVLAGGESRTGNLDPTGAAGITDVLFDYFHYVQVGGGAGVQLGSTTVTQNPTATGTNQLTSAGNFAGQNGVVNWTAVSSIAAGSPLYMTTLTFTSAQAFGALDLIQYLDEDVYNVSDDNLVVFGTSGAAGFQLLTVDGANNVGVSQSAGFGSAQNATYLGWAADQYSQLKTRIQSGTQTYSVAGVVDLADLPAITDARFPGQPAYGPEDVTTALAFRLNPSATTAQITLALGGSPSGRPVPTPDDTIPEPSTMGLFGAGAVGLLAYRKYRK